MASKTFSTIARNANEQKVTPATLAALTIMDRLQVPPAFNGNSLWGSVSSLLPVQLRWKTEEVIFHGFIKQTNRKTPISHFQNAIK